MNIFKIRKTVRKKFPRATNIRKVKLDYPLNDTFTALEYGVENQYPYSLVQEYTVYNLDGKEITAVIYNNQVYEAFYRYTASKEIDHDKHLIWQVISTTILVGIIIFMIWAIYCGWEGIYNYRVDSGKMSQICRAPAIKTENITKCIDFYGGDEFTASQLTTMCIDLKGAFDYTPSKPSGISAKFVCFDPTTKDIIFNKQ